MQAFDLSRKWVKAERVKSFIEIHFLLFQKHAKIFSKWLALELLSRILIKSQKLYSTYTVIHFNCLALHNKPAVIEYIWPTSLILILIWLPDWDLFCN